MELRHYQRRVINQLWAWFRKNKTGNPLIKCPTGSGKTHILAEIIVDAFKFRSDREIRALVLTHNTKLVEQNHDKFAMHAADLDYGLNCASLGKRDTKNRVIFAGIQSIYKSKEIGVFDLIIVDECHYIPKSGDGMYLTFINEQLKQNPKLRVVGLTATDYRLSSGKLTEGEGRLFTEVVAEITIQELLDMGFLVPIRYLNTKLTRNMNGVNIGNSGDFNSTQAAKRMMDDNGTSLFITDAIKIAKQRKLKKWKLYCTTLEHCEEVLAELRARNITADIYSSKVSQDKKEEILKRYSTNRMKALVSCEALITGFDETKIDFIINLKPTKSKGRWQQLCGRGMRPHALGTDKAKKECFLADYTTNTLEHGRADLIEYNTHLFEKKEQSDQALYCPKCAMAIHHYSQTCDFCEFEFKKDRFAVLTARSILGSIDTPKDDLQIYRITGYEVKTTHYNQQKVIQVSVLGYSGNLDYGARPTVVLNEFLTVGKDQEADKSFFSFFTHNDPGNLSSVDREYITQLATGIHSNSLKTVVTVKNKKNYNLSVAYLGEGKQLHWKTTNKEALNKLAA